MTKLKCVIETGERETYNTLVDSVAEFKEIIKEMNVSGDSKMIIVGDIAIRAGNIKTIYLAGEEE